MFTNSMDLEPKKSDQMSGRGIKVAGCFLFLLLLATIVAVVVLALLLRTELDRNFENLHTHEIDEDENNGIEDDVCNGEILDVAVIGSGPSGAYTAWKLSDHHSDWKIKVFDANNRIGGRLYSITVPGISSNKADLGAMRLYKDHHHRLTSLIDQLNLTIQDYTTPNENDTIFSLRGVLLDKDDLAVGNVPYAMDDYERSISKDSRALYSYWNNQILANDSKNLADAFQKRCIDGKLAFEKGLLNAYSEVASGEAVEYLLQRIGFIGGGYGNRNYAKSNTQTSYTPSDAGPTPYSTIREGFQTLSTEMLHRVQRHPQNGLHLNHKLREVNFRDEDSVAILKFTNPISNNDVTVCSRRVILGVPRAALKQLHFDSDVRIVLDPLIDSTFDRVAGKTYFAYNSPWWRTTGTGPVFDKLRAQNIDLKYFVTDKPIGVLIDVGVDNETGNALLVSYYGWWQRINFWEPFQEFGEPLAINLQAEEKVTSAYLKQFNLQLSQVFNVSIDEIPMPYAGVTHSWSKAPYFTGWHNARAGYNYPEAIERIKKPVADKELYVIGETYSNLHGWVEGALETSEAVLREHFGINDI